MSWKLIDLSYQVIDAAAATAITDFCMSGVFYEQTRQIKFAVGNTGRDVLDFKLLASGINADIIAGVSFSDNKSDWENVLVVSGVDVNRISPPCYCRFACPDDILVDSGSFLLRVEEI